MYRNKPAGLLYGMALMGVLALGLALCPGTATAQGELIVAGSDHPYVRALETLLPEFEAESGIRVQIDTFRVPLLVQRADLELASGTGAYDVMMMVFIQSGRWIEAGWVEPLNDLLGEEADLEDFVPGALAPFARDGNVYAVPWTVETTQMAFREDLLQEAGIEPPGTFEELLEAARGLTTSDHAGIVLRGSPTASQVGWVWPNFLQGFGGDLFAKPPEDMRPTVNSPEAVQALEYFLELVKYAAPGVSTFQDNEAQVAMLQGQGAIWIDALGLMPPLLDPERSKVADRIGFAPIPAGPAGRKPQIAVHGWMIPKGARNLDAAAAFIEWATSKETMLRLALDHGYMAVPRTSVLESEPYAELYSFRGYDLGELQSLAISSSDVAYRTVPMFTEVGDRVGIAISEAMAGMKSARQALDDAQRDIVKIMADYGYTF